MCSVFFLGLHQEHVDDSYGWLNVKTIFGDTRIMVNFETDSIAETINRMGFSMKRIKVFSTGGVVNPPLRMWQGLGAAGLVNGSTIVVATHIAGGGSKGVKKRDGKQKDKKKRGKKQDSKCLKGGLLGGRCMAPAFQRGLPP